MKFTVYLKLLPNSLEISKLEATDLEEAVLMVKNLRAQGFKAWATVEVAQ